MILTMDDKTITIAIDSFKGCMTSHEANLAAAEGVRQAAPNLNVESFDVSDGGEGFLEAMRPDEIVPCHVHDAMMRWTDSAFGIKDGKAIIEVAKAVGLAMIEPEKRNAFAATSYGVGELIVHAMEKGCREFVIGLGGSATSDCGLGMLRCLKHEWQVKENKSWYDIFDTSWLHRFKVTLATDVSNPLLGYNGAAHVFAPQKGADAEMVKKIERRARTFAQAAAKHLGKDMSDMAGAGAAGGLGYAFMEFMDARTESGAELVMRSSGLDKAIASSQMVITGEGSADGQTLMGKLPSVVLTHGKASNVPVALMTGKYSDKEKLMEAGFSTIININDGQPSNEDPLKKEIAAKRLTLATRHYISATFVQN